MRFSKLAVGAGAALFGLGSSAALALEPFVIDDIRVEGLQRIAVGTVFTYLPLKVGETLTENRSSEAVRALFRTGFFDNVVLERENGTLVVFVEERPAIASIEIVGNEDIPSEQLLENLEQIGFAEGRVFDRSMLDKVEQELQRQYLTLGKYSARVESTVTPLERNRVAVKIAIGEGEPASIKRINIVGNSVFEEDELLDQFELGTKPFFSWFSSRDQYSKEKLAGDLETLRSWYLNRGFVNFNIESTQVSITPDKQDVYITINVREGEQYRIGEVRLSGETVLPEAELQSLIAIEAGAIFSRAEINRVTERIGERLGDQGYAFANINPIPEIDEERKTVDLNFFVDPGKRVYVRRINVTGNLHTKDEVIRREIRQMEAAPISTQQLQRSRTRIDRLGFFEQVSVETPPVPGSPDEVDVEYRVVERPSFGSLNLGLGYGQSQGLILTGSITQENFLGTGKRFTAEINNGEVSKTYGVSYTDPYWTMDGVSRTLRASFKETNAAEADIGDFSTDQYGVGVGFGVPVSEFTSYGLNFDYETTKVLLGATPSNELQSFCSNNAGVGDCEFTVLKFAPSWTRDSRNRTLFANRGSLSTISAQYAHPVSDNEVNFYKVRAKHQQYFPLGNVVTLGAEGEIGYGDGVGDSESLPPYEHFYAGGARSVRGFKGNSLGPQDSTGDPLGGNARVLGTLELIFPSPFAGQESSTRLSAFVDAGNVFNTDQADIDFSELRYSAGVALVWLTPIGPLSFSLAEPLNDEPGDDIERFQFTLGMLY